MAKTSLNSQSINLLIETFKDGRDRDEITLINEALLSFMHYANSIYKMEAYIKTFGFQNTYFIKEYDQQRHQCHNEAIVYLESLNQLCDRHDIPVIYSGTVSRDMPYRREIADSVLEYVFNVVSKRN